MSALTQPVEKRIYIDVNNFDPMDTLAPLLGDLPHDQVPDTSENRVKAALACCVQLTRRLTKVEKELWQIKESNNLKKTKLEKASN